MGPASLKSGLYPKKRSKAASLIATAREHPILAMVTLVPVLLVALVLFSVPRSYGTAVPHGSSVTGRPRAGSLGGGGAEPTERYAVVLDAGSTGTRVHTYLFLEQPDGSLVLENDDFHSLKPGLSAYAGRPAEAAASIEGLLSKAELAVPVAVRRETPIELRATAGLRLLPGSQAEDILSEVRRRLHASPFRFADEDVTVLDGQDEAAFAWLALNYLQGRLGRDPADTSATVDMGGGSIQLAYAMDERDAARAPEGYVREMSGAGRAYPVYVHSWLGYGLMAGRAQVLSKGSGLRGPGERRRGLAGDHPNPCVAEGPESTYRYSAVEYPLDAPEDGPAIGECRSMAREALNGDQVCAAASATREGAGCLFDGAWGGPWASGGDDRPTVHLMSYLFDRAVDTGLARQSDRQATVRPSHYLDKAGAVCEKDTAGEVVDLLREFGDHVDESAGQFMCMDLVFMYELLTSGFQIAHDEDVHLVRQVEFAGEPVEVTWTLGAAINSLGRLHRRDLF